jgi:hypothetical protein
MNRTLQEKMSHKGKEKYDEISSFEELDAPPGGMEVSPRSLLLKPLRRNVLHFFDQKN